MAFPKPYIYICAYTLWRHVSEIMSRGRPVPPPLLRDGRNRILCQDDVPQDRIRTGCSVFLTRKSRHHRSRRRTFVERSVSFVTSLCDVRSGGADEKLFPRTSPTTLQTQINNQPFVRCSYADVFEKIKTFCVKI